LTDSGVCGLRTSYNNAATFLPLWRTKSLESSLSPISTVGRLYAVSWRFLSSFALSMVLANFAGADRLQVLHFAKSTPVLYSLKRCCVRLQAACNAWSGHEGMILFHHMSHYEFVATAAALRIGLVLRSVFGNLTKSLRCTISRCSIEPDRQNGMKVE